MCIFAKYFTNTNTDESIYVHKDKKHIYGHCSYAMRVRYSAGEQCK